MSRLYIRGETDARKTPLTSRAHKIADIDHYFNHHGGNQPDGGWNTVLRTDGDSVIFRVTNPKGKLVYLGVIDKTGGLIEKTPEGNTYESNNP